MHRGYSIREIQRLPKMASPEQMEQIMEAGFSSLSSLVLAEASGGAPLAARDVLNRASNCELWLWVLLHVRSNLTHSMALRRLEVGAAGLLDDREYRRLSGLRSQVMRRIGEARKRIQGVRTRLDREMVTRLPSSNPSGAMIALMDAEPQEYRRALVDVMEETGVPAEVMSPPEGAERDPQWAARVKVIREPLPDSARELLWCSDEEFADKVGDDTRAPGGLNSALRHPLLLTRWGGELERLSVTMLARLGVSDSCPMWLPDKVWLDVLADEHEARKRAGRMRFFEALQTRRVEQEALLDSVSRQIRHGIKRQQINTERRARELLRERMPNEFALYSALTA